MISHSQSADPEDRKIFKFLKIYNQIAKTNSQIVQSISEIVAIHYNSANSAPPAWNKNFQPASEQSPTTAHFPEENLLRNLESPYSTSGNTISPRTPDLPTEAASTDAPTGRSAVRYHPIISEGYFPSCLVLPLHPPAADQASTEEDEPPPLLSASSDDSEDNQIHESPAGASCHSLKPETKFLDENKKQTPPPTPPLRVKPRSINKASHEEDEPPPLLSTSSDENEDNPIHESSAGTPGHCLKPKAKSCHQLTPSLTPPPHEKGVHEQHPSPVPRVITDNHEPYHFQALQKRRKATRSQKGVRRLRFADTDSLWLEEAIQRNQIFQQAQCFFSDMQFEFINDQEEIFRAHLTKYEQQHLRRNEQHLAANSLRAKEAAVRMLVADRLLEDLEIIHRDMLVIH